MLSSPLTQPLTPSQSAEKERQRLSMLRPLSSKVIRKANGEHFTRLKQVKEEEINTMDKKLLKCVKNDELNKNVNKINSSILTKFDDNAKDKNLKINEKSNNFNMEKSCLVSYIYITH